jgi:hypothetical protein
MFTGEHMSKLRLGIFGDSYADINPREYRDEDANRLPWPIHLAKLLDTELHAYSLSGTSLWWSYKNFLKYYKDLDIIVFVYTEYNRWNTIGSNNIDYVQMASLISDNRLPFVTAGLDDRKEVGELLLKVRPHIFDEEFNLFTYQNIFNSINFKCGIEKKKIVNILAFDGIYSEAPIDLFNRKGPVLQGLAKVGFNEIYNNDVFEKLISTTGDKRFCHTNPHNNFIFATIIKECLDMGGIDIKTIYEDDRFSYDPEHLKYITG